MVEAVEEGFDLYEADVLVGVVVGEVELFGFDAAGDEGEVVVDGLAVGEFGYAG